MGLSSVATHTFIPPMAPKAPSTQQGFSKNERFYASLGRNVIVVTQNKKTYLTKIIVKDIVDGVS